MWRISRRADEKKAALDGRRALDSDGLSRFRSSTTTATPKTPSARTPKRGTPTESSRSVAKLIDELGPDAVRRVTWRKGTKGSLSGRFAMLRVRPADGPRTHPNNYHLPGDEVWLIAEFRTDETKYYFSNLPASVSIKKVVSSVKARWSCEQVHQQMKEELGLDHTSRAAPGTACITTPCWG